MKIGDKVIIHPIVSKKSLEGCEGILSGITGDIEPFHYSVEVGLDSYVLRGDELELVECVKRDTIQCYASVSRQFNL